jgi:hypothetical protein
MSPAATSRCCPMSILLVDASCLLSAPNPGCVSEHSGSQALQPQRPQSTGHFRPAPPSRKYLPIHAKWKLSTLDGPTTTGFKRQCARPEIEILEAFAFSIDVVSAGQNRGMETPSKTRLSGQTQGRNPTQGSRGTPSCSCPATPFRDEARTRQGNGRSRTGCSPLKRLHRPCHHDEACRRWRERDQSSVPLA